MIEKKLVACAVAWWPPCVEDPPSGILPREFRQSQIVFLRRTTDRGTISVLETSVAVDKHWPNRLVRCELNAHSSQLTIHALRRRQPEWQPLLATRQLPVTITPWHNHKS